MLVTSDLIEPNDPLLPHIFNFKRMIIALRLRLKGAVAFIIAVTLLTTINKLNLNVMFGKLEFGLATSLLVGMLFSWEYGFLECDVAKAHLLRLAMIRCALQKNQLDEADIRLKLAKKKGLDMYVNFVKISSNYPKIIIPLINALQEMVRCEKNNEVYKSISIEFMLLDAESDIKEDDLNSEYYIDAIRNTLEILYPKSIKNSFYYSRSNFKSKF